MAKAVIQEIVSEMFDALTDAGLTDAGTYTAPGGGSAVPCRVAIRRGAQARGSFGSIPAGTTQVTLQLSEIPSPQRDGLIDADGETFKLTKRAIDGDTDATSTWEVAKV